MELKPRLHGEDKDHRASEVKDVCFGPDVLRLYTAGVQING